MKSQISLDENWDYGSLTGSIYYDMNYFKNWLNKYGEFDVTDEISEEINLPVGCLTNIKVNDNHRNNGYGNKILEHFIEKCINNDVKYIILVADLDEYQLTGFYLVEWYKSKGFIEIGKIYDNPVMKLSI